MTTVDRQRRARFERVELADGFDDFYAVHVDKLILQLWAYTGDHQQAEDVVQEAFCRAFARWSVISAYDDPAAWVRRVAINLATNRFRQLTSLRRFISRYREAYEPEPSPDRVLLVDAIARLPPAQRRAIVLRYLGDLSVSDIARQEDVSENTVKSWLRRGRSTLAALLLDDEMGGNHA
jgi:RNA polymerase sigma-70 factor (ECF subfamily)